MKAGCYFGRDRLRFHFRRIGWIALRPNPGFSAFNRNDVADHEPMLDIKARTPELAHVGGELDTIAEARWREKPRAGIDQWQAGNAECGREIRRLHAERSFEQRPCSPVEELEEMTVEDDAGGVAMAPLNGKAPAADEFGHSHMIAVDPHQRQLAGDPQKS